MAGESPAPIWGRLEYVAMEKDWRFPDESCPSFAEIVDLHQPRYSIGRNQNADLRLQFPFVSNNHCAIYTKGEELPSNLKETENEPNVNKDSKKVLLKVYVQDLKSSNGTYVNGVELHKGATKEIRNGDVVCLSERTNSNLLPFYRLRTLPIMKTDLNLLLNKKDGVSNPSTDKSWRKRQEANAALQAENKKLQEQLESKLEEKQNMTVKMNWQTAEIEKLKRTLKEEAVRLEELQLQIKRVAELEGELNECRTVCTSYESEIKNTNLEMDSLKKEKQSVEESLTGLSNKLAENRRLLQEETHKSETLQGQLQEQQKENRELKENLDTHKNIQKRISDLELENIAIKKERALLQVQSDQFANENKTLIADVERAREQMQKQQQMYENERMERQELLNEINKLKQQHANHQIKLETEASRTQFRLNAEKNDRKLMEERFEFVFSKIELVKTIKNELEAKLKQIAEELTVIESQKKDLPLSSSLSQSQNRDIEIEYPLQKTLDDEAEANRPEKAPSIGIASTVKKSELKRKRTETSPSKCDKDEEDNKTDEEKTDEEDGEYDSGLEATQKTHDIYSNNENVVVSARKSKIQKTETITEDTKETQISSLQSIEEDEDGTQALEEKEQENKANPEESENN